ncbi:MAG: SdrD B-like domain-containing protein, partial [Zavarzinella sp.]
MTPRKRDTRLQLNSLEERVNPVANPVVTILDMPSTALIGSDISFTVDFDNADLLDTGYGPYIDLFIPATGADGNDGLTNVAATYSGAPLTTSTITLTAGPQNHPFALDAAGNPRVITPPPGFGPGDQLLVIQLPFGSIVPDQPDLQIEVTGTVSNLADANVPLQVAAQGGFRFGSDPLNNPTTDNPLLSGVSTASTTPVVMTLTKTYIGPENETATGPNFVRQYRITVDVANGQTISNLQIADLLPDNLQYVQVDSVTGNGTTTITPVATPGATPGGSLIRELNTVVGTAADNDAELLFSFFAPQLDAGSNSVLNPTTGDDVLAANNASASGTWDPLDVRDGTTLVTIDPPGPEHELTLKSIATQKSVATVVNAGATGTSPGDVLEYAVNFQVSDFFAFNDLVITDTIQDGLRFDETFVPTLTINGNTFTLPPVALNAANYTVSQNFTGAAATPPIFVVDPAANDGTTTISFRVSDEMISRGILNGNLLGGLVNPTTGAIVAAPGDGPTTGTLTFRAVIQDQYTDDPGPTNVTQGDSLNNVVNIDGAVLTNTAGFPQNGQREADNSSAGVSIPEPDIQKSIYAINGNTGFTSNRIEPGDTVTYRIRYEYITSDQLNTFIRDYLPLPIFNAAEVTTLDYTQSAVPPPAGTVRLLPTDTYSVLYPGVTPTLSVNLTENMVQLQYGDANDPANQPGVIDLVFTVTVTNLPFADELLHTNQVEYTGETSTTTIVSSASITQVVLEQPSILGIQKGVVATSNAAGVFAPTTVGPVTFNAPGTAGARFAGTINSTNLASNPINSNLSNIDNADLVTFAVVVENIGTSSQGAFDIRLRDLIPTGFVPTGVGAEGVNLRVTDGAGNLLAFTTNGSFFSGVGGIELTDGATGALGAGVVNGNPVTDGSNILVITYDLISQGVTPAQQITNTATLFNYANSEAGPDFTATDLTNDATVQIRNLALTKVRNGTEIVNTFNTISEAVIGELITYTVTVTVPEGVTPNAVLTDTLDSQLAFVDIVSTTLSPGLAISGSLTPVVTSSGQVVTFNLGNITNSNTDNSVAETITITYTAVPLNVNNAQGGTNVNNSASLTFTGAPGAITASAPNTLIIEPRVVVNKTVLVNGTGTVGDANDPVSYTIVLSNPSGANNSTADAFDVTFNDPLPIFAGGSTIINPTFTVVDSTGTVTAADFELVGDNVAGWTLRTLTGTSFDLLVNNTRTITLTVNGTISPSVVPSQTITNTASTSWSSLDGTPGPRSTFNANSVERTGAGGINDYTATNPATHTIQAVEVVKQFTNTSETATTAADSVVVGEIVRYRLLSRVPESTSTTMQFVDQMPAGMQFLNDGTATIAFVSNTLGTVTSSTITDADPNPPALFQVGDESTLNSIIPQFVIPAGAILGGPFGNGTDVTFDFGSLTNTENDANLEFVVIEFNALVLNVAGNQAGTSLSNTYSVVVNGTPGTPSGPAVITVAEPNITNVDKVAVLLDDITLDNQPHDAGDRVRFRNTFTNGPAANIATAYNVRLTDTPPTANMTLDLGSIRVFRNGVPITTGFTNSSTATTVDVSIDQVLPNDAISIFYDVILTTAVVPGANIANTATVTYTSLPGPNGTPANPTGSTTPGTPGTTTGERTGDNTPGTPNDYTDNDTHNTPIAVPTLTKAVFGTSIAETTSNQFNPTVVDAAIGETVTYRMTVVLPEGTNQISLTDQLPVGAQGVMRVVSSQVVSLGANLSGSALAVGASGVASDTNADTNNDLTTFNFGTITNTPDGVVTAADQVVVEVVAQVINNAANVAGLALTNNATLTYPNGNITANANVEVVQPQLEVIKTVVGDSTLDANGTVTYQVTVRHAPTSTGIAYGLSITDTLPAGLQLTGTPTVVSAPNYTSPGWTPPVVSTAGNTVTITAPWLDHPSSPVSPAILDEIVVQYQATVVGPPAAGAVTPGSAIPNTATTTFRSSPDPDPTVSRPGTTSSTTNVTVNTNSISGNIYTDLNNNGIFEPGAGETLITSAVNLRLTGTDHLGNAVNVLLTTSTGQYSFSNLRPSNAQGYTITQETQPAGFVDGIDTPGNLFGGSALPPTGDQIATIVIPLDSNANAVNYNFGELIPASIGNFVWNDTNGNGVQDTGEPGIVGISIQLTGTDNAGNTVNATTTSGVGGAYSFNNLRPGTYTLTFGNNDGTNTYLRVTQNSTLGTPATDSNPAQTSGQTAPITLTAGQTDNSIDAGYTLPASIGDFVWFDIDGDGIQDPGEPGIPGVQLQLFYSGTDGVFNGTELTTPVASITTDATGNYTFDNLLPGLYRVQVNPLTAPSALTTNTTPVFQNRTVVQQQTVTDADFGLRGTGSIGDRVYMDLDGDGVQDTGDPNLPGVQVTLVWGGFNSDTIGNGNDITIGTVTTTNPALASQPNYLFGNLPSGNYSVQVSATGGSGGVPANVNLTDSINDAVLDPNAQPQVFLNIGQNLLNVDFGYQGNATIGDTVWYDVNGNGIRENGPSIFEPGIANAVVTVTFAGADGLFPGDAGDTGDQIVFTTTTNASGTYQLTGLPANLPNSPYRVTVTPPAGFTVQTFDNDDPLNGPFITPNQSALTLAPGQTNLLQDFGYRGTASIGDFVWNDLNGDGIQQGGEPGLDGVQVSLLQAGLDGVFNTLDDQVIAQTTTAGGGAYSFNGLVAGNYQLAFGNTDGTLTYQRSPQNTIAVGATPANDSDASATTGRTNTITLADGEINGTIDAGLFLGTSVGNSIFNDLNNNGLQDVGEVGINEVEVILYDAAGTTALQTTTTNAQGLYLFSGLAAGSYVIEVSAPNFNAGNVLENFTSSTGLNGSLTGPFEPGANANTSNVDGDDNGTIVGTLGAGGVIRTVAVVLDNTEPTGENPNNDPTTPDNQSNLAADMGVFLPSTIGNTIFNDLNNNGLLDVSEVGIDNVEVVLLDGTGTPLVTTTTAGGGLYSFSNLGAGNYQVQISATNFNVGNPLAGFQSSTPTSTTPNDGIDNDDNGIVVGTLGTGGVVQTNPFAVTPGTTNNTLDFGLFGALSIGNLVFDDVNNNGVQDVGENGISGVEVVLLNGTGTGIATTTTDANGQYLFTGLAPAEYRVRLSAANFNLAGALVGYRSSTGAANAFEGAGTPVPGTSNVDNDDNGTTTGTLGSGGFIETPTFLLQGVQPTGETPNNDPATPDDRSNLAVDFGVYRTQSLGNVVFNDLNNNGIQDVGELGINEVEVILYDAAGTTALQTTTTNAQGLYLFSGLAAGSYVIEVSAPNFNVGNPLAGFTSSTGLNGSLTGPFEPGANANTSNVDGDDNGTIVGTLGAGGVIRTVAVVLDNTEPTGENPNNDPTTPDNQSNLAADMGVFLPSTIGNTIFNDLNNNGLLDVGEVGIDNVEVVLLDGTGTPLVTTTTAGGGLYSFSNLGAGNYQVQISATNFNVGNPLAGFQSSTTTSTTPNDGIDNDDNGVVVGTLGTGGVVQTNPFAVTPGTTNNTLD